MKKRHFYKNFKNINFYKRKRESLLKDLWNKGLFVSGCIVDVARRCGNKRCKCAKGDKHVSKYLSYRDSNKKRTAHVYIPLDILEEVERWNVEYKRIKKVMEEICQIQREIIRKHVVVTRRGTRVRIKK